MGENKKPTQCERVLNFIKMHGEITTYVAYSTLKITRLASRIFELKEKGVDIVTEKRVFINEHGEKCPCVVYKLGRNGNA